MKESEKKTHSWFYFFDECQFGRGCKGVERKKPPAGSSIPEAIAFLYLMYINND